MKFEDLSYLQKIRMVGSYIDTDEEHGGITVPEDIFLQCDFIKEEVHKHPDFIAGVELAQARGCPYTWKDMMQEAENEISAKWMFRVYLKVKEVLNKGDSLK